LNFLVDIDLILPADIGFDINKFSTDEEGETYEEKGFNKALGASLKIYLSSFY
jgi:hypothetical protein